MTGFDAFLDNKKSSKSAKKYPIVIQGDNGEDIILEPNSSYKARDIPEGTEHTSTPSDIFESFLQMKDNI